MYFDTYNHGSPLQNSRIFIIKLCHICTRIHCFFDWKLFIWIPPPLKYCAAHGYLAVGSWQTWQTVSQSTFVSGVLKVQVFIFAWISIETDQTNTFSFPPVFLQFSSSFPLVFLQFLGLIEAKTFLLQHFVETRAVWSFYTFVGFPWHKR